MKLSRSALQLLCMPNCSQLECLSAMAFSRSSTCSAFLKYCLTVACKGRCRDLLESDLSIKGRLCSDKYRMLPSTVGNLDAYGQEHVLQDVHWNIAQLENSYPAFHR